MNIDEPLAFVHLHLIRMKVEGLAEQRVGVGIDVTDEILLSSTAALAYDSLAMLNEGLVFFQEELLCMYILLILVNSLNLIKYIISIPTRILAPEYFRKKYEVDEAHYVDEVMTERTSNTLFAFIHRLKCK